MSLRDFSCGAISRVVLLRDFLCGAISRSLSLRNLFAERSHALCRCEIYLRSGLTRCVVARFICVAVSRVVSLRNLFA